MKKAVKNKEQKWIEIGYTLFAKEGPKGLKVDTIAKLLNTSRSSFYYHFAEIEIFQTALFHYHVERAKLMAESALNCQNINPDLINAIIAFKEDLLFNRQLRVHRHMPDYAECLEKAHRPVEQAFLKIWAKEFNLENNLGAAQMLLRLVVDNFYMRISEENLNLDWLTNYLNEVVEMARRIEKS